MSMLSAGSYQSQSSVLSGQSDGSVLSWQSTHRLRGRRASGSLDSRIVGSLVVGTTVLVAAGWLRARRRG
jgi:hypothetical protein